MADESFTDPSLSAGGEGEFLVSAINVSSYGWISLFISAEEYDATLTPEYSFTPDDESSWRGVQMYNMNSLDGGDTSSNGTTAQSVVMGCPVFAPYFRVKMTDYVSGTATGVLQLLKSGPSALQLLTTYVRILPAKNDIGFVNNDGTGSVAIAAGHVADTLVSQFGGMLSRILVTTAGSVAMTFYDSNTGPSGTIVGIIKSTAVAGDIIECKAPLSLGIVAKGDAGNPGVTVFFAS